MWPSFGLAQTPTPTLKFPRTANIYLGSINKSDYDRLSSYDLIVIIPEIQYYNPDFFAYARAKNPRIKILPYIYSSHVNLQTLDDPHSNLKRKFLDAAQGKFLLSSTGNRVSVWDNIVFAVNANSPWAETWPSVVQESVLGSGLWDGVFYDVVDDSITHYGGGDIDITGDGVRDDPATINRLWRAGMARMLERSRQVFGPDKLIIINGSSVPEYQPFINGRMFESFPTPWEGRGQWVDSVRSYLKLETQNLSPTATIINTTAGGRGTQNTYSLMRYGLASALLGDGYSSYNQGVTSHAQLWFYDEYGISLGEPIGKPVNVLNPTNTSVAPSVWRRDFAQGAAFVNATEVPVDLELTQDFERLHGIQDKTVNNGQISSELSLNSKDGILLLKPLESLIGVPFINGAFARIFTSDGTVKRTGFFSYSPVTSGGSTVVTLPPQESPTVRAIAAVGNQLVWYDGAGNRMWTIKPYGEKFNGTITFAMGDIEGVGRRQIITIPQTGGTLHIRSFTMEGAPGTVNANITTERVNRNSIAILPGNAGKQGSIVIGAGVNRKPLVSLYRPNGALAARWGAFEGSFLSGVSVAVLPGAQPTIIVGRNAPGKGEVRLFDKNGKLKGLFFAFRPTALSGVVPAVTDLDGDGTEEILALTTK
ncbi:hypothetical protein HZA86_01945 [Candidatus Uhrbacteria bacterium]|nr:hypothetical protein [Candidatus Uhrbacteria bacterium]